MNSPFAKKTKLTASVSFDSRKSLREERMTLATKQHMPLMSAYLCQDCDCVGNSASRCPACGSTVLLGLSGVLNREANVAALEAA
jgi:predicted Zn-ribbon and HTH transcriptional regulator